MERSEQETTITYDMEQQVVRIFSAIRKDQGRLKRAGILPTNESANGYFYNVPLNRLRWRITTGKPSRRGFGTSKSPRTVDSKDSRG